MSLPRRLEGLAGREGLLAELHGLLAGGGGPRVVVLCGLGGVGKTSLAAEYGHRYLAELSVAWQVPAEDDTLLARDLAELAAQLGDRDLADPRDPVRSVHAVMAAWPSDWLLIFDNARDEASVRRFLPPAGRGRVIVTTQSQHWPGTTVLQVPSLDTDVAATFLTARTGDPDTAGAAELAGEVGGLPLALEQAAAYIQVGAGQTLAGYLALFRRRRAELLAQGGVPGHEASVAATIGLAMSRLAGEFPAAAGLMSVLAFLAPEPVPLDLLLTDADMVTGLPPGPAEALAPLSDPVQRDRVVAALRRYSLITPAGPGVVLIHRLVQDITKCQLPADTADAWERAAAMLVETAIPGDVGLPESWPACASLLPHARALLGMTSDGLFIIANGLGNGGSHAVARDLIGQIASALENAAGYGPEHPETLATRGSLADWTGLAGDRAAARDMYAELVPIYERLVGPEDPETLAVRANLAYWTGQEHGEAAARDMHAELVPIYERLVGPEDPETLAARASLALWTGKAGDRAAARDMHAELVPIYERVLGPDHPKTLAVRVNLAAWTGFAGDRAAARGMYAELVPIYERVLGPDDPESLTARGSLAYWTGEEGDQAAHRDRYADLVAVRERLLGPEHPQTLAARASLALWTGLAGDEAAALDIYSDLVPAMERVLGLDHPDTRENRHYLDDTIRMACRDDPAAARDLYAEMLSVRERVLGPEHPVTVDVRRHLAYWTSKAEEGQPG